MMSKIFRYPNCLHALPSALRPVVLGVAGFVLLNLMFTLWVTISPLNSRFNFSYGNFLPAKLSMLRRYPAPKPNVLFLGTSQTNNGFIPSEFDAAYAQPGRRSFNLGLPNNRYDIMLAYLKFHQRKYGAPKLLLVELSPSIQEKNAALYYLPALYYRTLIEQAPELTGVYLNNPLVADNVRQELWMSALSSLHQYRFTFSPVNVLNKMSAGLQRVARVLPVERVWLAAAAKGHRLALRGSQPVQGTNVAHSKSRQDQAGPQIKLAARQSSPSGRVMMTVSAVSVQRHPAGMAQSGSTQVGLATTDEQSSHQALSLGAVERSEGLLVQPEAGWYPKLQSPHMTTAQGLQASVREAKKYYIEQQTSVHFDKLAVLLAYCQQQHIPVVLVSWPNHPAFLREFNQSTLSATYQQGLSRLARRYPVPMIQLGEALPFAATDMDQGGFFADPRHLTPQGAQWFSRRLGQAVAQLSQPKDAAPKKHR